MPFVAQQQEKCTACNRTVYQTEKTVVEELDSKKVYHKSCIRCTFERCNKVLSLGEFSSIEGKFYCKPHFKQLFAEKGNFEEGFGLEKKSKGTAVSTPGTFVPVESTKQNVEKKETSEATAAKFRKFREDAESDKCTACGKTVYVTEKIIVEEKESKKPYHKTCLKCSNEGCGRQLDLGSYVSQDGTIYCKPHFQQLFKSKGTFESIDSKDKWKSNPVVTEKLSFIPKEDDSKVQTEKNKTSEATAAKIRMWRQESDSESCAICAKSVAPVERLVAEEKNTKKVYHNACFKCSQCGVKLDLRNYGSHEGNIYCRPHLKGATVTNVKPASSVSVPTSFVPEVKEEKSSQKSETPSHIAEKFKGLGSSDKCRSCGKSVYATEKLIVEELKQQHIYHKLCLRCSKCNIQLDASTYGSASGVIYCKVHLKQMALPEQVKSENAYFISPLRSATNDYAPQQDSEDINNDSQDTQEATPVEETREQEQEEPVEEATLTPVSTSTPTSSYKPSPLQSPKDSPVSSPSVARRQVETEESNNSDDERRKKREERERQREEEERRYQEEKEKRDKEREERRKRRDEDNDSNATEEDDAEKRKKEREERRKRREEEAQKELEEQERKSEERRKRLEALKQ